MYNNKILKTFMLSVAGAMLLCGCSSDTPAEANTQSGEQALYLRGDMNDYSVSETYRLRASDKGLCTEAALHADWSPYHFKFADAKWSSGSNFGYAMPPGSLEEGSRAVKLNANSKFEDVTFRVRRDGIYRFCLVKQNDGYYATAERIADGNEKSFKENVK